MKILFYDMGSYTYNDFIYYLRKMGHQCKTVYYHFPDKFQDTFFCERFISYLNNDTYDVVVSINFFPLVAELCNQYHIKYISWCYDSPLEERLQTYFDFETNYIFLFDQTEVTQYQKAGFSRVFHLPLAVNTERLDALKFSPAQLQKYTSEVSFVGHLYDSPLETLLYSADDYIKGYIEGILQAQLRIYGYNFLDELITEELLNAVNDSFKKLGQSNLTLNHRGLLYAVATEITHLERTFLLEQFSELFNTHFYTSKPCNLNGVKVCGPLKYSDEMPCVFRHSKINLNPTLKCIQSGIPLRALDIMGAKGVLLSNYQPELAEYFADETDCIMYSSMEDAVAKTDFYLKHEDLRGQIALNGYLKVKEYFSYPAKISEMFKIAEVGSYSRHKVSI